MELLYQDEDILVCIKPPRVLSTDQPGGLPELLRQHFGDMAMDIRTVHRLDRVVGGVMVLARSREAASQLSRQVREDAFGKEYMAIVHGVPGEAQGTLRDLLVRDKARKMTLVVPEPGKGVQEALLDYEVMGTAQGLSKLRVTLRTGRTHQIRVQFASRGMPLVGERKYDTREDPCQMALWSHKIAFSHPKTGEKMEFSQEPPELWPWTLFSAGGATGCL